LSFARVKPLGGVCWKTLLSCSMTGASTAPGAAAVAHAIALYRAFEACVLALGDDVGVAFFRKSP